MKVALNRKDEHVNNVKNFSQFNKKSMAAYRDGEKMTNDKDQEEEVEIGENYNDNSKDSLPDFT